MDSLDVPSKQERPTQRTLLSSLPPSSRSLGATRVAAASARTMVPRRSMGIFNSLAMKAYQLPKMQKVRGEGAGREGGREGG